MKELVIFETNNQEGSMRKSKKFYPASYTEEDIKNDLLKVREKIGEKYNFDGKKILQPTQKDVDFIEDYPDGAFKKVSEINLDVADLWEEKIPCDILILTATDPKIVVGHRMADCPVLIIEDRAQQVVAVSHCGASQINRKVPFYTEEALLKEYNSKKENLKREVSFPTFFRTFSSSPIRSTPTLPCPDRTRRFPRSSPRQNSLRRINLSVL